MPATPRNSPRLSETRLMQPCDMNGNLVPTSRNLKERIYFQRGKPDLDLSLCNLSSVPLEAIEMQFGLEISSLDLSYNRICTVTTLFPCKLVTLTKLDLSQNDLRQLPDNFGRLEQLVYLDVHKNQVRFYRKIIYDLPDSKD